jgi:sugar phosphate isomerase/epimerase
MALAAIPAARIVSAPAVFARQAKPDSKVRGVTIGMNVPYSFGSGPNTAQARERGPAWGNGRNAPVDEIIQHCVTLGVSGVELRTQPVEAFLGAPAQPGAAYDTVRLGAAGTGDRGAAPTPEQIATAAAELEQWRLAASMAPVRSLRQRFENAGVLVEIVKVDNIFDMPDAVIDYQFELARNLGARAISTELDEEGSRRLGQFADKHQMMVGYHGHAAASVADFERIFSYAAHNGANLDIGHFVAGQNTSPLPFLHQHHARITHIHVKDRKRDNGPNTPFGQGDTPIVEVLQAIRDNGWNIQATIEYEYPLPAGSDRRTELQRCVDYCRAALA